MCKSTDVFGFNWFVCDTIFKVHVNIVKFCDEVVEVRNSYAALCRKYLSTFKSNQINTYITLSLKVNELQIVGYQKFIAITVGEEL